MGWCYLPINDLGNAAQGKGWCCCVFRFLYSVLAAQTSFLAGTGMGLYYFVHKLCRLGVVKLVLDPP